MIYSSNAVGPVDDICGYTKESLEKLSEKEQIVFALWCVKNATSVNDGSEDLLLQSSNDLLLQSNDQYIASHAINIVDRFFSDVHYFIENHDRRKEKEVVDRFRSLNVSCRVAAGALIMRNKISHTVPYMYFSMLHLSQAILQIVDADSDWSNYRKFNTLIVRCIACACFSSDKTPEQSLNQYLCEMILK